MRTKYVLSVRVLSEHAIPPSASSASPRELSSNPQSEIPNPKWEAPAHPLTGTDLEIFELFLHLGFRPDAIAKNLPDANITAASLIAWFTNPNVQAHIAIAKAMAQAAADIRHAQARITAIATLEELAEATNKDP